MATIWEIPLTPRAQVMDVNLGGIVYTLNFRYNRVNSTWVMDIGDSLATPMIMGIPLVTGTDLLGQFRYLGIGGGVPMITMTIAVGHSPDETPTYDDLGIDSHLYYKTP
jgi:hypothetical protein